MKELGNLAIVASKKKDCMLQIYDNEVTVYVGHGPDRESITSEVNDDERIRKIIAYLNYGSKLIMEVSK